MVNLELVVLRMNAPVLTHGAEIVVCADAALVPGSVDVLITAVADYTRVEGLLFLATVVCIGLLTKSLTDTNTTVTNPAISPWPDFASSL